ncbi:MAG: cobalt-zinc-cadmium resistance protein CzcI [Pseudomonadota bacterium]|jgi:hypothetical protein
MRRLVFLVLAFLVAFQASWAMAAPYCLHERSATPMHFGHHQHEHVHESGSLDEGSDRSSAVGETSVGLPDADCSACHAASPAVMLAAPSVESLPDKRERFILAPSAAPPERVTRIERPNWGRLA